MPVYLDSNLNPHTCRVTSCYYFSMPQFPHLQNKDDGNLPHRVIVRTKRANICKHAVAHVKHYVSFYYDQLLHITSFLHKPLMHIFYLFIHQTTCLFIFSFSTHCKFLESRGWVLFILPTSSTEHGEDQKLSGDLQS